jgi:undecaprenyl-diphosphatase
VNPLYAVVLGVIQGLTEFLPISSTAHLTISGKLLGLMDAEHPEAWTAFIAVMQLGTLAAVIAYFFRDVIAMVQSLASDVRSKGLRRGVNVYSPMSRLALAVVAGSIPVAVLGLWLHKLIEGSLTKSTSVIIVSLVVLAILLWIAEGAARHLKTIEQIDMKDALIIGFAQALALVPGSSRSGTTITAGLFLGLTRQAAARFSFLLSIPAVLASGVYEMSKIDSHVFTLGIGNLVVATVFAAVSGYAAIHWLLRYLQRKTTLVFVWYRFGLGLLMGVLLLAGLLQP